MSEFTQKNENRKNAKKGVPTHRRRAAKELRKQVFINGTYSKPGCFGMTKANEFNERAVGTTGGTR